MARRGVYAPELLAYTRQRFEQTDDTLAEIEADVDIHRDTIRSIAKREGWNRYVRPPQRLPATAKLLAQAEALERHPELRAGDQGTSAAVSAQTDDEGATPPLADTIARLQRVVLSELAGLESVRTQLKRRSRGSAVAARTLATLTETLQKLQRLQSTPVNTGYDDADMPADIDEFRNELARRIDTFVNGRTDAGGDSGAVAPSMDAAV